MEIVKLETLYGEGERTFRKRDINFVWKFKNFLAAFQPNMLKLPQTTNFEVPQRRKPFCSI